MGFNRCLLYFKKKNIKITKALLSLKRDNIFINNGTISKIKNGLYYGNISQVLPLCYFAGSDPANCFFIGRDLAAGIIPDLEKYGVIIEKKIKENKAK